MHLVLIHDQYVLRLDVSVDNIPLLHVYESINHLLNDVLGPLVIESLLLPEFLIQIAILGVLKHYIDALVIVEVAIESDDIRVSQSPLNLKFLLHLSEEVKLLQQIFMN